MRAIDVVGRLAAAPTPSPTPKIDPDLVTPGPWGWIVVALLALAVILLVWDMLRRVRRARYREEVAAELDAEQAAERDQRDLTTDDPDTRETPR